MKELLSIFLLVFAQALVHAQTPQLVHDANPGSGDGGASGITSVGDNVYYVANSSLWMYDGTTAGEVTMTPAFSHVVGVLDGVLFFAGSTAGEGLELFKHDGTSASLVRDFSSGATASQFGLNDYAVMGGLLYFVAEDDVNGSELWSTNGTTTTRITDIVSGLTGSSPENLEVISDKLYFTADDGSARELYVYGGSTITKLQNDDDTGYDSVPEGDTFSLAIFNDVLYFTAYDATNGNDLWTYDGSTVSWFSNDISGNDSNPHDLTVAGSWLYWVGDGASVAEALYIYDGSSINIVESTSVSDFDNLSPYGDRLLLTYYSSGTYNLTRVYNGNLFVPVVSTADGPIKSYARVDDYVYYNIELDPGVSYKLGVEEDYGDYSEVFDINTGGNEVISNVTLHHTTLFFEGDDGTNGKELWKVRTLNYAPEVTNAIPDTSLFILDSLVTFDLTTVFTDQDNDELTFSALTAASGVLNASVSGDTLALDLVSVGTETVSVTATEASGNVASFDFIVNVINPYLTYSGTNFNEVGINDGTLESGEIAIAIAGDTFVNAGGALTEGTHYTINNLPEGFTPSVVVNASGDTATVTLSGQAIDHDNSNDVALNFTFTDAAFVLSDAAKVTGAVDGNSGIKVDFDYYRPVTTEFEIQYIVRTKGADSITYYLGYMHTNKPNYELTVTAQSSDETVATTSVVKKNSDYNVGYDVNVTPLGLGTSTITVSIVTEHGTETTQSFTITVIQPSLTFTPSVSLLDEITLTYEGERSFPRFFSAYFSPDGTKIFRSGHTSMAVELELNTPFDITSGGTSNEATSSEYTFRPNTVAYFGSSEDVTFSPDGLQVYGQSSTTSKTFTQYTLETPFDLRSDYTKNAEFVPSIDGELYDLNFSDDGLSLFYYDYDLREIQQLELTSPFDISSGLTKVATFELDSLTDPSSYHFTQEGSMIYIVDYTDYTVRYYKLGAPFDLSTAPVYAGHYTVDVTDLRDPSASVFYLTNVYWSKDDTKLYVETYGNSYNNDLYQYAVSPAINGFTETSANLGAVEGELLITSNGGKFANAGDTLTAGTHFTIDNLPAGLDPIAKVSVDGYQVILTLSGQATAHSSSDNIAGLQFTFTDAAFESGAAGDFTNAVGVESGFGVGFTGNGIVEVGEPIADSTLYLNNSIRYDISPAFNISPEETLTYEASVSDGAIADATISGTELVVTGMGVGNATITIDGTDISGNTVSQTFAIAVLRPSLAFTSATGGFTEAEANDGSVTGELSITITGDTLANANGILEEGTHFTINNLPAGLSATIAVAADGLTGFMSLSGQATNHDDVDNVTGLELSFTDAAFNNSAAADFDNAINAGTGFGVTFIANPIPEIIKELPDTTVYTTEALQYNLAEYFSSAETLSFTATSSDGTVASVDISAGFLAVALASTGSTEITVTAIGETNGTTSQLFVLTINNPYLVFGEDDGTGTLTGGFAETEADTGAVEGTIVIAINGDTFTNAGGTLESSTHFTIDNLPAGFTPVMAVSADGYQASLVLEGNTDDHYDIHSVDDLQFTFTDAAFTSGDASAINNAVAASSGFGVRFSGCGDSYEVSETACGSFEFDGQTLTATGTYEGVFSSSTACDRLVTLHLTILEPASSELEVTACESYEFNGEILTSSGTYEAVLTNAAGCDGLVTLHLTISDEACTVASTGDESEGFSVNLYPNPIVEQYSIDLGETYSWVIVQIRTMSDQIIETKEYQNVSLIESSIYAAAGVYTLSIEGSDLDRFNQIIVIK